MEIGLKNWNKLTHDREALQAKNRRLIMSDFIGDRKCVTHHLACDCREKMYADRIKELEEENERLMRKIRITSWMLEEKGKLMQCVRWLPRAKRLGIAILLRQEAVRLEQTLNPQKEAEK